MPIKADNIDDYPYAGMSKEEFEAKQDGFVGSEPAGAIFDLGSSQNGRYKFEIHGVPMSGQTVKMNRKTGAVFRPTEHKQRVYSVYEFTRRTLERDYGMTAEDMPLFKNGTAIAIEIKFYFPYRTSDYRSGKHAGELKPNAPTYYIGNKDIDNLLKPLKDGMEGVVYANDKQIVRYEKVEKLYSTNPRTEVIVYEI